MTYIVAEIGINHNGSLEIARKLIEEAAKTGCDAVKFQNYKTEDFVHDKSLTYTYKSQGKSVTEEQYKMFKRYEIDFNFLCKSKIICDKNNIELISTPTSKKGVDELVKIGCKKIKNGSDFLSNLSLIKYMKDSGLEVILSTGMAYKEQVDDAIKCFSDKSNLTLLHCTSSYPTNDKNVNLNRMINLRDTYKVKVGFSDHTIGSLAAVASTILGAKFIEKHYTLDHNLPGPDHHFSITPKELRDYVRDIKKAKEIMGSKVIEPSKSEKETLINAQLSIFYLKDLNNEILKNEDIFFSRPGDGISPNKLKNYIGKKLTKKVLKGDKLNENDFK